MNDEANNSTEMGNYVEEMKNGIFNLTISLCQHLSAFATLEEAKEQTAKWLEEIATGLRAVKNNPLESN